MKDDLRTGSGVLFLNAEAVLEIIHTPPQVDVSASKNGRAGNQGEEPVPSIPQRAVPILFPVQRLTASHLSILSLLHDCLIDNVYALIMYNSKKLVVFFEMMCLLRRQKTGSDDIQTYCLPVDRVKRNRYWITGMVRRGGPVFGEGQKKDDNPPPGKPDTPKKEKTGREGDKGSQRVKRPKKEGSQQA